jgi:hypothetical protein
MPATGTDVQAWIGLSDDNPYSPTKMDFRWTDGTNPSYFNWNQGEPADSEERCGRMYGWGLGAPIQGTWNNDLCAKTAAFVCIEPAPVNPTPPPAPTLPPTPNQGVPCEGRVFHYHDTQVPWKTAEQFCIDTYGDKARLASITSGKENSCIAGTVMPQGSDDQAWIGLTDDPDNDPKANKGQWVWTDGAPFSFTSWNTGEPADSEERCGRLYGGGMGEVAGKWNNDLCSKTAAFVCESTGATPAPPGKKSSSNAGAIAGGVIGAGVALGLGAFCFMKFRGGSSGGGLGRSLVANKRGTLF